MAIADSTRPRFSKLCTDLTGKQFGKLTVICFDGRNDYGCVLWKCVCECGSTTSVVTPSLKRGLTRSCGCLRRIAYRKTHGKSETAEYRIWSHIIGRCENKNDQSYPGYGGRGIKICERWRTSFENFLADMKCRPSDKHSIERKDNDGNYCPENCKWGTASEQARNKRGFRKLTHNGETMTLLAWSERTGIPLATIKWRFCRNFSVERILHKP